MSWLRIVERVLAGADVERRESGYSAMLLDAAVAAAEGRAPSALLAAVEAPVGMLTRAFGTAEVEAEPWVQRLLSPACLADAARACVLRGEWLASIEGPGDMPYLAPASDWDVHGGSADPSTWTYRLTLPGPHSTRSVHRPAASVTHLTYSMNPREPYRGRGPLALARSTVELAGRIEAALQDEATSPVASVLPVPEGLGAEALVAVRSDIKAARGGGGMGGDRMDWRPQHLGPSPADAIVRLREHLTGELAAAMGLRRNCSRGGPRAPEGVNPGAKPCTERSSRSRAGSSTNSARSSIRRSGSRSIGCSQATSRGGRERGARWSARTW